ncbi:MAG: transcriptional repressor [Spirochaetales bacterium]|nr:transcriptional repressor [Spirochaetales bacterium]MBP7264274.1 transcriptional repressor [Spirochaetia bacterium]
MHREERAVLERYLKERGLKMTAARETVLEAFLGLETHVTVDDILEAARALDPGIGQATVFRTMKLFADAGLAREACRDDGGRQYEHAWRHAHHDHLTCVDCGKVVEFVDPAIEKAQEAVYRRYGFTSSGHRLELFGRCPDCSKKRSR